MKKPLTVSALGTLLRPRQPPCISLYLPLLTSDVLLRWRSLTHEARRLLQDDHSTSQLQELMAPLEALEPRAEGEALNQGLAVFRSPELFATYQIPAAVPELVVVSGTFHTRPLVRYLNSNRHFFLLALSPSAVGLYEGTPEGLVALEPTGLPKDVRVALEDSQGRAHLSGQGEPPALLRYFRSLDRALRNLLEDERVPLILAGHPEHQALYASASRYPELIDEGIEGDVERMDVRDLHRRALAILENHFRELEGALYARLESALISGNGGVDLREVAHAAVHGRVRALLHAEGEHLWGKLDRATGALELRERQMDAEDAEVLDDLAEIVLLRGGDVFEVPPETLPSHSPVAAIYRY